MVTITHSSGEFEPKQLSRGDACALLVKYRGRKAVSRSANGVYIVQSGFGFWGVLRTQA